MTTATRADKARVRALLEAVRLGDEVIAALRPPPEATPSALGERLAAYDRARTVLDAPELEVVPTPAERESAAAPAHADRGTWANPPPGHVLLIDHDNASTRYLVRRDERVERLISEASR